MWSKDLGCTRYGDPVAFPRLSDHVQVLGCDDEHQLHFIDGETESLLLVRLLPYSRALETERFSGKGPMPVMGRSNTLLLPLAVDGSCVWRCQRWAGAGLLSLALCLLGLPASASASRCDSSRQKAKQWQQLEVQGH